MSLDNVGQGLNRISQARQYEILRENREIIAQQVKIEVDKRTKEILSEVTQYTNDIHSQVCKMRDAMLEDSRNNFAYIMREIDIASWQEFCDGESIKIKSFAQHLDNIFDLLYTIDKLASPK